MKFLSLIIAAAATASAKYVNNLNYNSPSLYHPFLGIALHKVVRRHDPAARSVDASKLNFTHGVASGDPYADSVILWTRCSPMYDDDKSNVTVSGDVPLYDHDTDSYIRHSTAPVCVNWAVSTDNKLQNVVSKGQAYTSSDVDYTLKVEAGGLQPFTRYYYQFTVCNSTNKSPIGRTKTIPRADDKVSAVNLAVYSCSNYPFGFFNAFGNPARKDSVDYVLHLGDFIYEYAEGAYGYGYSIGRISQPNKELHTLYDYRKRHASYRADLDSVVSFGRFPWIPVWDDHEVADNTYRDGEADQNNTGSSFVQYDVEFGGSGVSVDQRKMNAVRAYFEWMPIRQVEMDDNLRVWRSFAIGSLMDVIMLDTRQYDRSITDLYWNTDYVHDISNDAGRTMMGSRQENWFYHQLIDSARRGAVWRLVGSQTVFSRLDESAVSGDVANPLDYDAWDGYQANRNRTLRTLYDNNIGNNIIMAGDSHMSWASDLVWLDERAYDPASGRGALGVEFAGSAVSSPSPLGQNISMAAADAAAQKFVATNPELQWQDGYYRGYYELTVAPDAVTARYYGVPALVQRTPLEVSLANFTVKSGANALARPVAGGTVASGALKMGKTVHTNITNNTDTGKYSKQNLATFGYGQKINY